MPYQYIVASRLRPNADMIDFRQLNLFIAVAEELHFGRAAARVGMAQPPFSQQIRRIERTLGIELLDRTSRRVSLTSAGAALLLEARDLIARRDRAIDTVRRTSIGDAGTLRLGFSASSAVGLLPLIVRQAREDLPGVTLQIDDRDGTDIPAALRSGALDAAIVRAPFSADGLITETLHRDAFVAVLPMTHPLASEHEIALEGLADSPFILFPRTASPGFHDTIIGLCYSAGFSPDIAQEANAWLSVVGLVESGLGVTIAPALAAYACPPGVKPIALTGLQKRAEIVIAYRKGDDSQLLRRFQAVARSAVALK